MKVMILPTSKKSIIKTECYHNLRLSVILAYKGLIPWYMSHFYNLYLYKDNKGFFPRVHLEEHLNIYQDILEEKYLSKKPHLTWVEQIKKSLRSKKYVLCYLNWRNIPCSNHYNKQDLIHECLIYGFNDLKKEFNIFGYDINNEVYEKAKIGYQTLEREINNVHKNFINSNRWFAYYGFPMSTINLKNITHSIDMKNIFFFLRTI